MATISRVRRLVNPGKKKRKLSALQKLFFGSKRQRAAVKANKGRKRKRVVVKVANRSRRRKRNVGSIITVRTKSNPGRKRRYTKRRKVNKGVATMATRRRRRKVNSSSKRVYRRKRRAVAVNPRRRQRTRRIRNVVYQGRVKRGMYKYSSNPGRRRHSGRRVSHRRHYRRNPGVLTGTGGRVLGVLGGLAFTRVLAGFLPAMFTSGILGYVGIGAVAYLQGKAVGKISKNGSLGNDFLIGGLAYLGAKILNDFLPSFGGYTGISGMGLIGGSSFYVPQVNRNGSMGSFVLPGAVGGAIAAIPPAKAGMGVMRRTGRLM